MVNKQEGSLVRNFVSSVGVHIIFILLIFVGFGQEKVNSTPPRVNLSAKKAENKATNKEKEIVKAGLVDSQAVAQAVARQEKAEVQRQQEIKAAKRTAEKLRQEALAARKEAEQARKAKQDAAKAKAELEAEKKALEQQKDKVLADKQKLEQEKNKVTKEVDLVKAEQQKLLAENKAKEERIAQAAREKFIDAETNKYAAKIEAAIKQHRQLSLAFPPEAYCKIRITLLADGSLQNVKIIQSSGNAAYDLMSENAVRKAAPFSLPNDHDVQQRLLNITLGFNNEVS